METAKEVLMSCKKAVDSNFLREILEGWERAVIAKGPTNFHSASAIRCSGQQSSGGAIAAESARSLRFVVQDEALPARAQPTLGAGLSQRSRRQLGSNQIFHAFEHVGIRP